MENKKYFLISILVLSVILSSIFGAVAGFWAGSKSSNSNIFSLFKNQPLKNGQNTETSKVVKIEEESAVIDAVDKVSPAVVSIIVSKDLPVIEKYYSDPSQGNDFFRQFFGDSFNEFFGTPQYRQKGTEKQEIGGGSGFLVSSDGYIITNRHVALDEEAEYTVLMNDESKHVAKVLAQDQYNDVAILKIDGENFPYVELGDSSNLKVGQTVIAIGNALGEFRNTVSTGVISGLARSVTAGGYGMGSEQLTGVIQTDASINPGNSGGPLLNLSGQVIGMNTAMASGAENIGFTIPINEVKSVYENVKENGKIVRPWLGVRYVQLNEDIAKANNLGINEGALIVRGEERTDLAVVPGSPADKAGLVENDIIMEINGEKVTGDNPLAKIVGKYKAGDEITLKVFHKGEEKEIKVKLEEMKQ